jgi:hypothetical protein
MARRSFLMMLAAAACLASGCATRVAGEDIDAEGARVGAVIVLDGGETLRCRVLSLTPSEAVVDVYYIVGRGTELRGAGDERAVFVDGERVPGEFVAVEMDGVDRTALVRRTVALDAVATATFHRSGSEASLGPVLSALLGPIVGLIIGLLVW